MNIIGLDIGGTKITALRLMQGRPVKVLTILTPKNLTDFKAAVLSLVNELSENKSYVLGIGAAGLVDRKKKILLHSPNLKFIKNLHFQKLFSKTKTLKLDNDANCFARAEAALGQGRSFHNFAGLTLGTGIGGGLVLNKEVYTGAHGWAGEPGGMLLGLNIKLEQAYQQAKNSSDYKKLAQVVGILLVNVCKLFDPEAVILGGGIAQNIHGKFLPQALKIFNSRYSSRSLKKFKIIVSKLKNAGALGAALMCQQKQKE